VSSLAIAIAGWFALTLLPLALALGGLLRVTRQGHSISSRSLAVTFVLGGVCGGIAIFVEVSALHALGIDLSGPGWLSILTTVALVAPVESALMLAATVPPTRELHAPSSLDGMLLAVSAGAGFGAVRAISPMVLAWPVSSAPLALGPLTALACASSVAPWGYRLAASLRHDRRSEGFYPAWLAASVGLGLFHFLTATPHPAGRVGAVCVVVTNLAIAATLVRDLRERSRLTPSSRRRPRLAPPSMRSLREAFARHDRPIRLSRIFAGTLVTQGASLVSIASGIALGHVFGVDFAAVDSPSSMAVAPVALLAMAALASFPISGFLIARASSSPTLIEPATASALALVTWLVLMGVAAPIAFAVALGCAPIALALACAGAWVGTER
jgi:RsiW-degrading membrane proteinase PrsW (M82 family)